MKLTSLKQKYSDMGKPSKSSASDEYYPSLYLEEKQIEAMGIDAVRVGTEMNMLAKVRVASVSESKGGARTMSFEIVEAGIAPAESAPDAASILYPNEKAGG